ncbi:MAG: shikimate dehydrogenase [Fimbriimonadaceae bacterium]
MTVSPWREAGPSDYAVVGSPVAHSLSPRMHAHTYREMGLDLTYQAIEVRPGELAEAAEHLASIGVKGLNITVPLKGEAFRVFGCDEPRAEATNAVCLLSGCGWITDVEALETDLAEVGGGPALVVGAGGAARSAVVALARLGYAAFYHSRKPNALDEWSAREGIKLPWAPPSLAGFRLVINATSAGHSGVAPELDWSTAEEGALAYDLSYGEAARPFLSLATEHGLSTRDGLHMLAGQGAISVAKWLGIEPPFRLMREAIGCR